MQQRHPKKCVPFETIPSAVPRVLPKFTSSLFVISEDNEEEMLQAELTEVVQEHAHESVHETALRGNVKLGLARSNTATGDDLIGSTQVFIERSEDGTYKDPATMVFATAPQSASSLRHQWHPFRPSPLRTSSSSPVSDQLVASPSLSSDAFSSPALSASQSGKQHESYIPTVTVTSDIATCCTMAVLPESNCTMSFHQQRRSFSKPSAILSEDGDVFHPLPPISTLRLTSTTVSTSSTPAKRISYDANAGSQPEAGVEDGKIRIASSARRSAPAIVPLPTFKH